MIERSLIKDKSNYNKEQLESMENLFKKNFIMNENRELETKFTSDSPEIRIHFRLTQGILPVIVFRAIGKDLFKTIYDNSFLEAFLNTTSDETPSLIFHFSGHFRSFEFQIKSKDEESIKKGAQTVVEKLLSLILSEELPPETTDVYTFSFEGGDWKEVKQ